MVRTFILLFDTVIYMFISEKKLQKHSEDQIKRWEPGILQLAKSSNELGMQLQSLIRMGKAPAGTICPQPIEKEGLFKLDVDNDIWQDVGLEDDTNSPVPWWLGDESVWKGIKLMLLPDRCRLDCKRSGVQCRSG
jgi:hypothetical protein